MCKKFFFTIYINFFANNDNFHLFCSCDEITVVRGLKITITLN